MHSGRLYQPRGRFIDWPPDISPAIELDVAAGLVVGQATKLVRLAKGGQLDVENDADRCVALMSIAFNCAVSVNVIRHVEAASAHLQRGDAALANLRLIFADLPNLTEPADAYRLRAAEYLLDAGMSPRELLTKLGLDAPVLEFKKFDPDQPRVPSGSGRESGRWTDNADGAGPKFEGTSGSGVSPPESVTPSVRQSPHFVQVAANGPFDPAGISVVPTPPGDTLDPVGLNKPLSFVEQQAIADTFNKILKGLPHDLLTLDPHVYRNFPSNLTGAALPPPIGKYTTYHVPLSNDDTDSSRLLLDKGGQVFYTNNHYKSFYHVDLTIKLD